MSDQSFAIKVDHVSKSFKLPHEKQQSIKSALINFNKRGYEKQEVLKDVDFEIKKGEFFGIVGRNGSGKSTLLKLLAGIYSPNEGQVHVRGKLTPFIELGVGFNPELTGRENVFLNGALLGFSRKEMLTMYDEIVAFAELERFMDQKLKNYSSGMQVRLAFSIAIRARTEILLLDEVLAVGDAAFQRKCFAYFEELKREKRTVIFVSHDMESVRKYCDKVVWIDQGQVRAFGTAKEVIPKYMEIFVVNEQTEVFTESSDGLPLGISSAVRIDKEMVSLDNIRLENSAHRRINTISDADKHFFVTFQVTGLRNGPGIVPGVIITNYLGEFVTASNTTWSGLTSPEIQKGKKYTIAFKMPNIFESGSYKVSVNVVSLDLASFYAWKNEACRLECKKAHVTGGKVNPAFSVEINTT